MFWVYSQSHLMSSACDAYPVKSGRLSPEKKCYRINLRCQFFFGHIFGKCFVSLAVEHPKVGSSICTSDRLNTWAEQKKSGTLNLEMDSCRPHTNYDNYGGSLLQPGRLRYMSTCFILFGTFNTVMNSLPSLQLEALDCAREEVVVHSLLLMY